MSSQASPQSLDNVKQATGHDQVRVEAPSRPRLLFIDYIRVALTMLVILHHLAITYGALGPWYYQEPKTANPLTSVVLFIFLLINQSFFMGCFFLIAGYFTPGSYDRKGARAFLKDRFLRLGIPLVVFVVLINPFLIYLGAGAPIPYGQFLFQYGVLTIGPGPLWFVAALLLFDCLYALWRRVSREPIIPALNINKPPALSSILALTLALAVVTFLVRLVFPFGWTIPVLNFIPSNFPQYTALFIVGLLASRRNWLLSMPGWMGKVGLGAALVATLILFPLALSGKAALYGGIHWQAFIYALWESIMGVGMSIGLIILFRQRLNRQGRLGKFLSAHAYVVYIIHALVITCLAYTLGSIHLYPLLKFVPVSIIAIPLCFLCGYLVRKLPRVGNIL